MARRRPDLIDITKYGPPRKGEGLSYFQSEIYGPPEYFLTEGVGNSQEERNSDLLSRMQGTDDDSHYYYIDFMGDLAVETTNHGYGSYPVYIYFYYPRTSIVKCECCEKFAPAEDDWLCQSCRKAWNLTYEIESIAKENRRLINQIKDQCRGYARNNRTAQVASVRDADRLARRPHRSSAGIGDKQIVCGNQ